MDRPEVKETKAVNAIAADNQAKQSQADTPSPTPPPSQPPANEEPVELVNEHYDPNLDPPKRRSPPGYAIPRVTAAWRIPVHVNRF